MPQPSVASFFKRVESPAKRQRVTSAADEEPAAAGASAAPDADILAPASPPPAAGASAAPDASPPPAAAAPAAASSPEDIEARRQAAVALRKAKARERLSAALLDGVHPSWAAVFEREARKPYWGHLLGFLQRELDAGKSVLPPMDEVLAAFKHTALEDVRVVVVGQDPYPTRGHAHGLAFSVKRGVRVPQSLRNIHREVGACFPDAAAPAHGNLEGWARQGVLLLNACLTVEEGAPNAHQKKAGWEQLTDAVISTINRQNPGAVFVLWGKSAEKKCKSISAARHRLITTSHPSPLGHNKTKAPFTGSRCFARANALLEELGREGINWGDF